MEKIFFSSKSGEKEGRVGGGGDVLNRGETYFPRFSQETELHWERYSIFSFFLRSRICNGNNFDMQFDKVDF